MRIVGRLLVGLAALLALFPLLFALAGKGILINQLTFPDVDGIFHHTLVGGLLTTNDGHQPQMLDVAVAILHLNTVGISPAKRHQSTEHRQVHRDRHTNQRLLQSDGQRTHIHLHANLLGYSLSILDLLGVNAQFESIDDTLHHLRDAFGLLLAGRFHDRFQFRLRQSEVRHHLHQHLFLIVADGSQVYRQLVQFHVALTLLRFASVASPPFLNNRGIRNTLECRL